MLLTIHCRTCGRDTAARGIVDLIDAHTNDRGRFPCTHCAGTDTFIHQKTDGDRARAGERWIKGLLRIATKTRSAGYAPFVFLTAEAADGDVTGIEFKYYRRSGAGRGTPRRERSRRRGAGPVLAQNQLLSLVGRLFTIGVMAHEDLRGFATALDAAVAVLPGPSRGGRHLSLTR
ncbi:MAG: hypothetical protein ACRET3_02450 [Burkholderiales bacterium]